MANSGVYDVEGSELAAEVSVESINWIIQLVQVIVNAPRLQQSPNRTAHPDDEQCPSRSNNCKATPQR